jgi:hypothetical protein
MSRELSNRARGMLERALAEERPLIPDALRRAQLKRSLLHGAALAGAGQAAAASLPSQALATSTSATPAVLGLASLGPLAKGIAVGLLVAGGAIGGAQLFAPEAAPAAASALMPTKQVEPAVAVTPAPPVAAPAVSSTSRSSDERRASGVSTPGRPVSSDGASLPEAAPGLAAELELLNAAQAALRDGRSAQALQLLQRYDRTFPHGQLVGERLAAEVFAACQVGERARATRAAERFLQRDARSVLAGRVQRSCAFAQKGDEP